VQEKYIMVVSEQTVQSPTF